MQELQTTAWPLPVEEKPVQVHFLETHTKKVKARAKVYKCNQCKMSWMRRYCSEDAKSDCQPPLPVVLCGVIQMLPVHCSVISFIIFWIKYAYSWKIEHRGYMPHTLYVWYIVSMMLMWDKRREKEKYQGGRNVFKTCARFHFHALQRCHVSRLVAV